MDIDLLCRVVDNFGDAGTVYRMAKLFLALIPGVKVRLICDNISSLSLLDNSIENKNQVQGISYKNTSWLYIIPWEHPWTDLDLKPAPVLIENFACDLPPHYAAQASKVQQNQTQLAVEYLSAEVWTAELNGSPMLGRWQGARRTLVVPGVLDGTAGLIHDFWSQPVSKGKQALVFSYEQDYSTLAKACPADWNILVAAGRSAKVLEKYKNKKNFIFLDFLDQVTWDATFLSCNILVVRGEESLSRAILSGKPFVWHAYWQTERTHMVKVEAILAWMEQFFINSSHDEIWLRYVHFMRSFNDRDADGSSSNTDLDWSFIFTDLIVLEQEFQALAKKAKSVGDLIKYLMTFFPRTVYTPSP